MGNEKNVKIGLRIHNARKAKKLSMKELGKMVNLHESTISRYEKGEIMSLDIEKMKDFAKALDTTPAYLMGWEDEERKENKPYDEFDNISKIDKIKLPLLGNVACGEPIYANEDRESYIMVGTDIHADFCLQCKGDSMINARIHDGDIVFVKKQDIVNNGEIAVVIIDDEATLKRFYYYKEQNMLILRPENNKYQDIVITGEELEKVRVIGKAVAFQSDVI